MVFAQLFLVHALFSFLNRYISRDHKRRKIDLKKDAGHIFVLLVIFLWYLQAFCLLLISTSKWLVLVSILRLSSHDNVTAGVVSTTTTEKKTASSETFVKKHVCKNGCAEVKGSQTLMIYDLQPFISTILPWGEGCDDITSNSNNKKPIEKTDSLMCLCLGHGPRGELNVGKSGCVHTQRIQRALLVKWNCVAPTLRFYRWVFTTKTPASSHRNLPNLSSIGIHVVALSWTQSQFLIVA